MEFKQHLVIKSTIKMDSYYSLDEVDIFINFIVKQEILYQDNWYGLIGISSRNIEMEDEQDWIDNYTTKVDELCLGYYDLSGAPIFDSNLPLKDIDLPFIEDIKKYISKELIKLSI